LNQKTNDTPKAASAQAAMAAVLPPKKIAPLTSGSAEQGGVDFYFNRNSFHFTAAPAGCTPEELSGNQAFWVSAATKFLPYDTVIVVALDNSWQADFSVTADTSIVLLKPGSVVTPKPRHVGGKQALKIPDGYTLKPTDPRAGRPGWIVERDSDGKKYLNAGGMPWTEEDTAIKEFNDHAMFRDTPQRIHGVA
jgi:hypothetical protein